MGRPHCKNVPPEPAPEEAILKYNRTRNDKDGPSKYQFQPDFSTTPLANSPWNCCLLEILVGDYVQKGLSDGNVNDLEKYFMTYLQTLQTSCHKMTTTTKGRTIYEASLQRGRIDKCKKCVG